MKHLYTPIILFLAVVFCVPLSSEAIILQQANPKSICEVTMSHDALFPRFTPFTGSVKAGEELNVKLNITNRTNYIYKNTHILYKIGYFDKESTAKDSDRERQYRLIDVVYSKDGYDVAPGSTSTVDFTWKVPENSPGGNYRLEAYVVQNGVHVINDFARPAAYAMINFPVVGSEPESPITIRKELSYFGDDFIYPIKKLKSLSADDTDTRFTVVVRNSSNRSIAANYSWKVNNYGKFDDSRTLVSTSSSIILKPKSDTKILVQISDKPSNRYHAIFSITDTDGQKSEEIFRWLRLGAVPSLIDTYGVVKNGEFIAQSPSEDQFALQKDTEYIAFACLIGGYDPTATTLSMRIKNDDGNVIFSKEEKRDVNTVISSFEYPFKATSYSKKFDMEIMTDASGLIEKATWSNDCKNNKTKVCKNPMDIYVKYLIAIITIAALFGLYYIIKNKRAHTTQNE